MGKTNTGLVDFCKQAKGAKWGYVFGTIGQLCTKELLDNQARQYPASNQAGGAMRTVGNKWIGRRVVDCSGLIRSYLMTTAFGVNPVYNSKYDKSSRSMYAESSIRGKVSNMPKTPGVLLYKGAAEAGIYHVGVYIGGDIVIEAMGTAEGVVETKLSTGGWNYYSLCPYISYNSSAAPSDSGSSSSTANASSSSNTSGSTTYYSKYSGDSSSLVDALRVVGADPSMENRKVIASINGITGYTGTAMQNTSLLTLLKSGKLVKSAVKNTNATVNTPKIGDKVMVTGTIYGNGNGTGGEIKKQNETMYVVDLVNSSQYKYYIGLANTKGGKRQGWGTLSTIKQ